MAWNRCTLEIEGSVNADFSGTSPATRSVVIGVTAARRKHLKEGENVNGLGGFFTTPGLQRQGVVIRSYGFAIGPGSDTKPHNDKKLAELMRVLRMPYRRIKAASGLWRSHVDGTNWWDFITDPTYNGGRGFVCAPTEWDEAEEDTGEIVLTLMLQEEERIDY